MAERPDLERRALRKEVAPLTALQETRSTGRKDESSAFLNLDGLSPVASSHCLCVVSKTAQ